MGGKKLLTSILIITVLILASFYYVKFNKLDRDKKSVEIESSYKPMIKVNDVIYGFDGDLDKIDKSELEHLGQIKHSYNSIGVGLKDTDENFSSNVFEKGLAIYRKNDTEIIVVGKDFISKLKKLN